MRILVFLLAVLMAFTLGGCSLLRRKALFFPTHHASANGLTAWRSGETVLGFARTVASPRTVWLLLHGNGGQAADRVYALPAFSEHDSVYILEYPGYGQRAGVPSRASFDQAAREAYAALCEAYPRTPIAVAGESIGSGPACQLATAARPPAKIVLVVPFDTLAGVAADHFPALLVRWVLGPMWDNSRALAGYKGPVEIFGARDDEIIAARHARALADSVPGAKFHLIEGGHNDWAYPGRVFIRRD